MVNLSRRSRASVTAVVCALGAGLIVAPIWGRLWILQGGLAESQGVLAMASTLQTWGAEIFLQTDFVGIAGTLLGWLGFALMVVSIYWFLTASGGEQR